MIAGVLRQSGLEALGNALAGQIYDVAEMVPIGKIFLLAKSQTATTISVARLDHGLRKTLTRSVSIITRRSRKSSAPKDFGSNAATSG